MQMGLSVIFTRRTSEYLNVNEEEGKLMTDIDKLNEYIKSEVQRQIKEEQLIKSNVSHYKSGRYAEVRNKYKEAIRQATKGSGYYTHKINEAIRDIAKSDVGLQYMSRATEADFEKMADVYEVIAKAYLSYKESQSKAKESEGL